MNISVPLLCALLLAATVLACPANAHLPEIYGRKYLRVDPARYSPPAQRAEPRILAPPGIEEQLQVKQLEVSETAGGAYSGGLADPLANLARLLEERGDTRGAAAAYQRAIHLVRINQGLLSEQQLPLLRALMELYRREGNYEALGNSHAYYARVLRLDREVITRDKLREALGYLDGERELFATRRDEGRREHLLRAYRTNQQMLSATTSGTDTGVYLELVMSQMRNLYLILGDNPINASFTQAEGVSAVERELSRLQELALYRGADLLRAAIERASNEDTDAETLAAVYLEQGDWYQWNERLRPAATAYARVFELLSGAGEDTLLDRWLGEPAELPDEPDLWRLIREENEHTPSVIEARFEVTRRGELRRLDVTNAGDENKRQATRVARMLRDTHFRPRVGPDGPEQSAAVTRYYRLVNTR